MSCWTYLCLCDYTLSKACTLPKSQAPAPADTTCSSHFCKRVSIEYSNYWCGSKGWKSARAQSQTMRFLKLAVCSKVRPRAQRTVSEGCAARYEAVTRLGLVGGGVVVWVRWVLIRHKRSQRYVSCDAFVYISNVYPPEIAKKLPKNKAATETALQGSLFHEKPTVGGVEKAASERDSSAQVCARRFALIHTLLISHPRNTFSILEIGPQVLCSPYMFDVSIANGSMRTDPHEPKHLKQPLLGAGGYSSQDEACGRPRCRRSGTALCRCIGTFA
jgi:hypothetical protein